MDQGWRGSGRVVGNHCLLIARWGDIKKNDGRSTYIRRFRGCPRGTGRCRGWCPGSNAPRTVPLWTWGLRERLPTPQPPSWCMISPHGFPSAPPPMCRGGGLSIPGAWARRRAPDAGGTTPARRGDSRRLGLGHSGSRIFTQSAPMPHQKRGIEQGWDLSILVTHHEPSGSGHLAGLWPPQGVRAPAARLCQEEGARRLQVRVAGGADGGRSTS